MGWMEDGARVQAFLVLLRLTAEGSVLLLAVGSVHELGHLIGGLISGYSFLAFQVGFLELVKDGQKLSLRLRRWDSHCYMFPAGDGQAEDLPRSRKNCEQTGRLQSNCEQTGRKQSGRPQTGRLQSIRQERRLTDEKRSEGWKAYQLGGIIAGLAGLAVTALYPALAHPGAWMRRVLCAASVLFLLQVLANGIPRFRGKVPGNDSAFFIVLGQDACMREEYLLYLQVYREYYLGHGPEAAKKLEDAYQQKSPPGPRYLDLFRNEIRSITGDNMKKSGD